MKPLHIDFSAPSIGRALFRTSPVSWCLLALGLAACMGAGLTVTDLLSRQAASQAELRTLREKQAQRLARKPAAKAVVIDESQAAAVNAAIAQLNLPWRDVWNAIEAGTPANVAVLSIEPDARKGILKGVAEAKTSDAMIGHIEQLKQQAFFSTAVLTKHETNDQDSNRPLRFQFEAKWTEAAP